MRARFLWVVLAVLSALTFVVAMSVGSAVASPRGGLDQSYSDPSGDAGPGTDITSLTVRNDTAGGVSIQLASASPIVANHAVALFIDADRNQSTGDDGDEYWMFGGPAVGVAFFAWNGSSWAETNPAGFSVGAAASNITEFRFTQAAIGGVSGFNFAAASISIDPPNVSFWDAAPNSGYYSYDIVTAPPPTTTPAPAPSPTPTPTPTPTVTWKLQIGTPVAAPITAVAGRTLAVKFSVNFVSSKGVVRAATGKMVYDPTVAGRMITHKESFKSGVARAAFVVPKAAKGKLLKVRVKITAKPANGALQSVTRIATFRVK